jgi:hypothetical protein
MEEDDDEKYCKVTLQNTFSFTQNKQGTYNVTSWCVAQPVLQRKLNKAFLFFHINSQKDTPLEEKKNIGHKMYFDFSSKIFV